MKKLVFTVISIIFYCLWLVQKQDLFENKAELKTKVETLSSNQSKPDLSALQRKVYVATYRLDLYWRWAMARLFEWNKCFPWTSRLPDR